MNFWNINANKRAFDWLAKGISTPIRTQLNIKSKADVEKYRHKFQRESLKLFKKIMNERRYHSNISDLGSCFLVVTNGFPDIWIPKDGCKWFVLTTYKLTSLHCWIPQRNLIHSWGRLTNLKDYSMPQTLVWRGRKAQEKNEICIVQGSSQIPK